MSTFGIAEIFKKVNEQQTLVNKAQALQIYQNKQLLTLFKYVYDPSVKWLLPEGEPPYKPLEEAGNEGRFLQEIRKLYLFLEGGNNNLTPHRREFLFIQVLESISNKDAKILLQAKNKKLEDVSEEVVRMAFPNLLPFPIVVDEKCAPPVATEGPIKFTETTFDLRHKKHYSPEEVELRQKRVKKMIADRVAKNTAKKEALGVVLVSEPVTENTVQDGDFCPVCSAVLPLHSFPCLTPAQEEELRMSLGVSNAII